MPFRGFIPIRWLLPSYPRCLHTAAWPFDLQVLLHHPFFFLKTSLVCVHVCVCVGGVVGGGVLDDDGWQTRGRTFVVMKRWEPRMQGGRWGRDRADNLPLAALTLTRAIETRGSNGTTDPLIVALWGGGGGGSGSHAGKKSRVVPDKAPRVLNRNGEGVCVQASPSGVGCKQPERGFRTGVMSLFSC